MMDLKPALALPKGFLLVGLEKGDENLTLTVVSTQQFPCCPLCGRASTRVHSSYTRQVADLPCAGQSIHLLIQVRKYFCEESACPRKIFAERLTPFIEPFARVTKRLCQIVQIIGLATGGRLGVRVTDRLGIQTSRQTILRRIMALPTEPVGTVPQIGIDDFSFRRGRKFGTIIVDLQTHKMLDVLPDRTKESAAAWMAAHPEIELVSRDRGGDYASAAAIGAPQAVQCADRFHILKNLGEAVEGCVARHLAAKRKTSPPDTLEEHLPIEQVPQAARRSPKVERLQHAYREECDLKQLMAAWPQYGFSAILPTRHFSLKLALLWQSLKAETASEADTNQSGNVYFRPHYALFLHSWPHYVVLAQQHLSLNRSVYRPSYAFFGGQELFKVTRNASPDMSRSSPCASLE